MLTLIICFPSFLYANDTNFETEFPELTLNTLRNPFESQLPKKIIEEPIEEVKIKEPEPVEIEMAHDPEKPILQIQVPIPPILHISGIVWDTDRPQAIINGNVVDLGTTLEDLKIVAIRKVSIDVNVKGILFTLNP